MQSQDVTVSLAELRKHTFVQCEKVFDDHNTIWVSCSWDATEISFLFHDSIENFYFQLKNLAGGKWIWLNWGIGSAIHTLWVCIQNLKREGKKGHGWQSVIPLTKLGGTFIRRQPFTPRWRLMVPEQEVQRNASWLWRVSFLFHFSVTALSII